eukprot:gene24200-27487_t
MILYALLVLLHQSSNGLNELPTVNVDNTDIGVSGLSGGAFFAVQYHIAYSKTVRSVGVLAGGPYWCAEDQLATAEHACMVAPSNIDVKELKFFTKQAEKVYSIDPTSNLNGTKVFVLSGTLDTVVVP